jgi:hypothetical protein
MPEQELSIKEREQQLFLESSEDLVQEPTRPFADYLRETPAAPVSSEVKVLLWIAAIVVAILFAAAIWRASRSSGAKSKARHPPAAEEVSILPPSQGPARLTGPVEAPIASQSRLARIGEIDFSKGSGVVRSFRFRTLAAASRAGTGAAG